MEAVVDVRRFPGSRRNPQFNRAEMAGWLPARGIDYRWEERLGGRRNPGPDSVNRGLRNRQFGAYTDHMATPEFRQAVGYLIAQADTVRVAVMCSESVWWRCHRHLLADHLVVVEGREVVHLAHDSRLVRHQATAEARAESGRVVYGPPTLPIEQ